MPISVVCPECKLLLTVDDAWAGHRIACERCGTRVMVPQPRGPINLEISAGEPPPPARPGEVPGLPPERGPERPLYGEERERERSYDYDDGEDEGEGYRDRGYGRRRYEEEDLPYERGIDLMVEASGWGLVRVGLSMMFWGFVGLFLLILAMIGFFILVAGLAAGMRGGGGFAFGAFEGAAFGGVFLVIFLVGGLTCLVVTIVGQCLCCTAPEPGAKGKAIGSVICLLLSVALFVGFGCMNFSMPREGGPFFRLGGLGRGGDQGTIFMLAAIFVASVVFIVGHVLLISFLAAVARHFGNHGLAKSTGSYLSLYFTLMGLQLALGCLQGAIRDPGAGLFISCLGIVLLVMGIILVVWYIRLLGGTRDTIAARRGGGRY